jgi:hypothetical protein
MLGGNVWNPENLVNDTFDIFGADRWFPSLQVNGKAHEMGLLRVLNRDYFFSRDVTRITFQRHEGHGRVIWTVQDSRFRDCR